MKMRSKREKKKAKECRGETITLCKFLFAPFLPSPSNSQTPHIGCWWAHGKKRKQQNLEVATPAVF